MSDSEAPEKQWQLTKLIAAITGLLAVVFGVAQWVWPDGPSAQSRTSTPSAQFDRLGTGGCRDVQGTQGDFELAKGSKTLAACMERCLSSRRCTGVEFNDRTQVCEIHFSTALRMSTGASGNAQCYERKG